MCCTHFVVHPTVMPGTLNAAPAMLFQVVPSVVCSSAVHRPLPCTHLAEASAQPPPPANVRSRMRTPCSAVALTAAVVGPGGGGTAWVVLVEESGVVGAGFEWECSGGT